MSFLHDAVRGNRLNDVKRMLEDPDVDPNAGDEHGTTPFMKACYQKDTKMVRLFLDSKREINYNQKNGNNWTALHCACNYFNSDVVQMLVMDPRIDIASVTQTGKNCFHVVFWRYGSVGTFAVVKVLLASDRPEIPHLLHAPDVKGNKPGAVNYYSARYAEVDQLVDAYDKDPVATRNRLRRELWCAEYMAAELFATIVLLCDDYYEIKD